ncbi:MAG: RecQ family ATP-dependent DNA helicase [Crocinitomicaceae bacterium]|nr:RecQ family ATP-dependent DNA helicase [Crocinitomicaceae bacterium]
MKNALEILGKYWGYPSFRKGQEAIISAIESNEDVIALLPTGGGKSICYQVPGLMREGICIVISPLIALMEDQIHQLSKRNIRALMVNSTMTKHQIDIALDNACYGNYKFLYIAPERLETRIFKERLKKMNVSMIAIDEAHCISEWGHDFRPAYQKIHRLREELPNTPMIALTATATREVTKDIEKHLNLKNVKLFESSFERPNLSYHIHKTLGKQNDLDNILNRFKNQSGIIYASSRKAVKETYDYLYTNGFSATFYHGGLGNVERKKRQNAWTNGDNKIMVATNAFGMGIDKGDVRFVIHIEPPQNIESYFQEAGRAGRDNEKAEAHLLFSDKDLENIQTRHQKSFPDLKFIKQVYVALASHFQLATGSGLDERYPFDLAEFSRKYRFDLFESFSALKILENNGLIYLTEAGIRSSSMFIKASKEAIYSEQVRRKVSDQLINFILRTSVGIFDKYVSIDERKIAEKTGISLAQVKDTLQHLKDLDLIDYLPSSQSPEIIFTSEIIAQNNLRISSDAYSKRKEVKENQLNNLIQLLETKSCIQKEVLKYFGFQSNDCGNCSNCLRKNKSPLSKELVWTKITSNSITEIAQLAHELSVYNTSELIDILRIIEDEGKISISMDGSRFEKI